MVTFVRVKKIKLKKWISSYFFARLPHIDGTERVYSLSHKWYFKKRKMRNVEVVIFLIYLRYSFPFMLTWMKVTSKVSLSRRNTYHKCSFETFSLNSQYILFFCVWRIICFSLFQDSVILFDVYSRFGWSVAFRQSFS